MSLPSQQHSASQAIHRQKVAIISRLRRNFLLKVISLCAAILLHFYVQAERNPVATRVVLAKLVSENTPPDVEVTPDQTQIDVVVTGPKPIVDQLKDGDIHANANLRSIPTDRPFIEIPVQYSAPKLMPGDARALNFDPPIRTIRMQVFPQKTRFLSVTPLYPPDPPAGMRYERPDIRPARVKIVGRADYVDRVVRLIVNAAPTEATASIDGDYTVSPRDADNVTVDAVRVVPETVHLSVPLVEELPSKIVFISPSIADFPVPPYRLASTLTTPRQVRVTGQMDRINQISSITTEDISAQGLTETKDVETRLVTPPGIKVQDLSGRDVTKVSVQLLIEKTEATSLPSTSSPGATPRPNAPR